MKLLTHALIVSKIIGVTFFPLQCFLIISDTDIVKGNNKQTCSELVVLGVLDRIYTYLG